MHKDDREIEVLAFSSKNGAIGQNTLKYINFRVVCLIFTGQIRHLDMVYP